LIAAISIAPAAIALGEGRQSNAGIGADSYPATYDGKLFKICFEEGSGIVRPLSIWAGFGGDLGWELGANSTKS
jgi:hypothetical protein